LGSYSGSTRERIIDAAERTIRLRAKHRTFDAVASNVGVSSSGILYRFTQGDPRRVRTDANLTD